MKGETSLLNKFLASLGIGAAKIDLILDTHSITMGQQVTGRIVLTGGEAAQEIENLSVNFCLSSVFSQRDAIIPVNEVVSKIEVTKDHFVVKPHQQIEFPFSFVCPDQLPVSSINTRYYFDTNLEIRSGIDADDRDFVDVHPVGMVQNFLQGFSKLGLVVHLEGFTGFHRDGVQVFDFYPTSWAKGQFDELVFSYQPQQVNQAISGWFEIDRKTTGLLGKLADELDLDEKKGRFYFSKEQLCDGETAAETIRQFILSEAQHLIGK